MKTNTWKRGMVLISVVAAIVMAMAGISIAATICVNKTGEGGCYTAIQSAINAATYGDTVKVAQGSYSGNLTISGKNIKLIGGDPSSTTIQGTSSVITISGVYSSGSNEVEIAGFSIIGGANYGIYLNSDSVKAKIHNNLIVNNTIGIYATLDSQADIYNNVIAYNSGDGIDTTSGGTSSPILTVSNNIITSNVGFGIDDNYGIVTAFNNNLCCNTGGTSDGIASVTGTITDPPDFLNAGSGNYRLATLSPSINKGRPIAADNDPDGTRNDQGAYGGPFAAAFWPYPTGGPVITELSVTPSSVPQGGTITIRATGEIR
jgi:hypothetical protein